MSKVSQPSSISESTLIALRNPETFHIGPGWAAVLVALAVPLVGFVWYAGSASARTETKVEALDKRTEKIETQLYAIAIAVNAKPVVGCKTTEKSTIEAFSGAFGDVVLATPKTKPQPLPNVGAKGWP